MPENTSTMPEPMDNSEDSQQPMNPAYSAATLSAEEEKDLEVYECLTNIINELEPHALLEQIVKIKTLPIDSVPKMQDIIDLIFDKVAEEPDSCRLCAEACKELKQLYAYDENTKGIWTFEELLTDKCRQQLEYFENIESTDVINEEAICIVIGSQQKEKIQELYKEKVDKKKCWITSCKFASELFKLDMLSAKITLQFLSKLMHPLRDQTLQCLCELLLMIGKKLEFRLFSDADKETFEELFHSMSLIWKDEELKYKISPEVKCKLIEVITLKHHHWEISENKKNHSSVPPGISKNSVVTVTNTKEIPIIHAKIPKNQNKIPIMSLNVMKTENLSPTLLTEMKKLTENLTKACRYNNDFVEDENDTLLEIFLWEFVNQKKTLDSIIIWIDQNFENSRHNIELIRKLVTAITRIIYNEWSKSGIYGEEKDMIIEAIITRMNKLFELYIHTFDQEIISLLTVIKVVEDSGYPKDLAKNISEILLKFNLLSNDSFHTLYHRNCCVSYTNYTIEEVRGSLKNIEGPSTIIDEKECNEQSVRSSVFGSTEGVLPHSNVVLESDPKFDNDTFYSTAKSFEIIYNLFPKNTGKTIYRGTRYQGLSYIPFKRVDQLEYAANLIFKMVWENPLLLDDYSLICEAMRNISVGEKSFPIILNKELSVHLAEIMQSEDAYEDDDQHKHITFYRFLVKLTKKQLIEEEKLVHFLKWLLEKNPDLFCEIYENMELRSNLPDRDLEESIHYKLSNDVDLDSCIRKRLKNISMFVSNRYRRFGIISKPTESSSQTFTVEDRSFKMDSEIKKLQENQSKLMEEVLKTREVAEKSSKKLDEIFNLLADLKKTNSRD